MKRYYFLMLGFLFFSLIGLLYFVFHLSAEFHRELFFAELFILFSIVLMFGFYNDRKWVWKATFIFFLLFGFNLLYIKSLLGSSLFLNLLGLLSLIILFLSLFHFNDTKEEVFEKAKEEIPKFDSDDLFVEEIKPKSLGVFVASKNSSIFHKPTCTFAKRIKEGDKVLFANKAQATKKKYRAHACAN